MKLYGISGLGADKRVFKYLTLNYELEPIEWISPQDKESIEAYASRLSKVIDTKEFGIIGVSFGGLVAVEISKILKPKLTILISTVETRRELRAVYKIIGRMGILRFIPTKLLDPPRKLTSWIFGAQNKQLLKEILNDTDLSFTKWAIHQLLTWKNTESLSNKTLIISGPADKLMPPRNQRQTILIPGGEHFMIVDKAQQVSDAINKQIAEN